MDHAAGAASQTDLTAILAVSLRFAGPGELHLVKCIWYVEGPVVFGDELQDDMGEWWVVVDLLERWEGSIQ